MNMPSPIPFNPAEHWPDPDLTLLKPERLPAPKMAREDFDLVYGPWADWIRSAADVKGAPLDYVAGALLATASAVLGNARWPSPWEGWKEPPILWVMCVGDPSSGKSPALDAVLDPVKEIERELSEDYQTRRAEWEAKAEIASLALAQWKAEAKRAIGDGEEAPPKPEAAEVGAPPVRERIAISDSTTEKAAELLSSTWRGLLQYRDELSGWLGGMDRYSNGGDRPFWLEAFGGRPFTVDRKSSPEPVIVERLSIAVLGGTQPDKLASLLVKTDDDGLLARFLTIFPEPVPLTRPTATLDGTAIKRAFCLLRELGGVKEENGSQRPFLVPFSGPASDALQEFRVRCREWEGEARGVFKGHIGKLPGLAVRVSCVLAHLDWAAGGGAALPDRIEVDHVGRACHLVGEYLRLHAFRAYGATEVPEEIRQARRLGDLLLREAPRQVTVREIQRRELSGLQTSKTISAALRVLEEADWLRQEREESGGRPRTIYVVNPKLWVTK